MKKYLITVKGISYEVEVEELGGNTTPTPKQVSNTVETPVKAPVTNVPSPKPAAPPKQNVPAGAKSVNSPMPGSIFKVVVKAGDTVKKGDLLIILEAMKMENEIYAAADGVVATVQVNEGATVNTGDVLVTFN